MLGAVIGDIVGSKYEWHNINHKFFEFFDKNKCFFTDDSVMTLAIAKAFLESKEDFSDLHDNVIKYMKEIGRHYPDCGYGFHFNEWIHSEMESGYYSCGNGAAMRVSACAYVAKDLDELKKLSKIVTEVTHNHAEGLKGAEAIAVCIFMALHQKSKIEIKKYIQENYYDLDFTIKSITPTTDEIKRGAVNFRELCQDAVPPAIVAFLESKNYEDAIRNAISIGGDSDTIAAITGSIAEACYGVPEDLRSKSMFFLNQELKEIVIDFEKKYPPTKYKEETSSAHYEEEKENI